ncbi:histidine phosphatase family protein [Mycolicibacterium sp.]|uniref:histidine phosphatase family protein n=1 Tax=Mycolicibacterium sp. TaxID=2320850 RepID=UPI003D0DE948
MPGPRAHRVRNVLIAALTAVLLVLVTAIPSWAMTVTFVRHAESLANEAGIIDTEVPGPGLSDTGKFQAEQIAPVLAAMGFDGIYVSSMRRTWETAQPMLDLLPGSSYQILPGLREIPAGIFEGASEDEGLGRLGYALAPALWMLGARFVPVPGGEDGNAFDARVDGALEQIAENGDDDAVAFAHGATIMFWVMMNVDNPDLGLLLGHQLDNAESVVVEGSPEEGWTLVSWAGQAVSADPSLLTKLFVNVRDLIVAPQTALYNVGRAFVSGDIGALVKAVFDGVVEVAGAALRFIPDTVRDIFDEFRPAPATADPAGVQRVAATLAPRVESDEVVTDAVTVTEKGDEATDVTAADEASAAQRVGDDEAADATGVAEPDAAEKDAAEKDAAEEDAAEEDVAEEDVKESDDAEEAAEGSTEGSEGTVDADADAPADDEAEESEAAAA